jgi:hypothetical protein
MRASSLESSGDLASFRRTREVAPPDPADEKKVLDK